MTAALPSFVKIQELRLRIVAPTDDAERPITRQAPFASAFREMWAGDILLAPMSRENTAALAAFLESLDGRTTSFKVQLQGGKFGQETTHTGSLVAVPALGADTIWLNLSPASGVLRAGTLLTLGDVDGGPYQLFEVLQDVLASGLTPVRVAPRVRKVFDLSSPAVLGTVFAKFQLAIDDVSASLRLSHGLATVHVLESLEDGIGPAGDVLLLEDGSILLLET